jgi:teichuronic acid biosynthesis glycosyltransferase TuaC
VTSFSVPTTSSPRTIDPVKNGSEGRVSASVQGTVQHIGFIAGSYPTRRNPTLGMFLAELVRSVADDGTRCSVINPIAIHKRVAGHVSRSDGCSPEKDGLIRLFRPLYLSLSARRIGPFHTGLITQWAFQQAVLRALLRLRQRPDALYGHFLYSGGAAAVRVGKRLRIPSFVAVGEGVFWSVNTVGWARAKKDFRDVTGVIAVSSLLRRRLIEQLEIPCDKIAVFPNGADMRLFRPRPRGEMRRKYGLPDDKFIVAFVGDFIPTKGIHTLVEAIRGLDGVAGIFAGLGPLKPAGENVLLAETVPHEQVPELLCAADAFVLPTHVEGSCNAIVEAMACGLPIVTSNGEFNDDLVNDVVSIRIDPLDVAAIRQAILALQNDPALRQRMGAAAAERGKLFDLQERARKIRAWMEDMIKK